MKDENQVNPDRNEMVALIQQAKGAQFAQVTIQTSRIDVSAVDDLDELDNRRGGSSAPVLTYKAIGLNLEVGDIVVVQFRQRFGLGKVTKLSKECPTSDEYDYRMPLRHIVSKVDVARSAGLSELDKSILQKLTASEAKDRLERLTRQMGIDLESISLELPKPEEVIE